MKISSIVIQTARVTVLVLCLLFTRAHTAPATPRILLLETMTAPIVQQFTEAFITHFKELNPKADLSHSLVRINAQGDQRRAEAVLAQALSETPPELVVAVATLASKAALKTMAERKIPVVFMCVTDPVGAGLIPALNQPGERITGKIHYIEAETKIRMVLKLLAPIKRGRPIRLGYIYTDYPADLGDFNRLQEAVARIPGLEFIPRKIPYRPVAQHKAELLDQVRRIAAEIQDEVDYFWAPRGVLAVLPEYDEILMGFEKTPLLVGATEQSVAHGALVHITGDPISQARDTAALCQAVLQGQPISSLPPTLPRDIQFSLNLKTALQMNLPIPSDILELAKGHLYQ